MVAIPPGRAPTTQGNASLSWAPRPGTAEWIRASLADLGYSEVECRRLSEALVHLGQDIAGATRASPGDHAHQRSQHR